jgi:hypothetical protein
VEPTPEQGASGGSDRGWRRGGREIEIGDAAQRSEQVRSPAASALRRSPDPVVVLTELFAMPPSDQEPFQRIVGHPEGAPARLTRNVANATSPGVRVAHRRIEGDPSPEPRAMGRDEPRSSGLLCHGSDPPAAVCTAQPVKTSPSFGWASLTGVCLPSQLSARAIVRTQAGSSL